MLENIIQTAQVAGQFYEANPERLRKNLAAMAEKAEFREPGLPVRAVILPHAGYMFSGLTALKTMAQAKFGSYKRALLLAPTHHIGFRSIALPAYSGFRTPLGTVPADLEALTRLQQLNSPLFQVLGEAHYGEHALEVELPMWQFFFGDRPIIPLITGQLSFSQVRRAAEYLKEFFEPETLWIVSSDFTHYGASFGYVPFATGIRENLAKLDGEALGYIEAKDLEGFERFLERTGATICGAVGIEILLAVLRAAGEKLTPRVVEYTTSGALTGEWSHCVSYAGIAVEEP